MTPSLDCVCCLTNIWDKIQLLYIVNSYPGFGLTWLNSGVYRPMFVIFVLVSYDDPFALLFWDHVSPPVIRGCLFYGPPGTGKTLVARALANECSQGERKVSFFMRKGADCLSKWVGESERQLRLLFDQVKRSSSTHLTLHYCWRFVLFFGLQLMFN